MSVPCHCLWTRDADLIQIKDKKSDYVQTHIIPLPGCSFHAAKASEGKKPSRLIPQVKSMLDLEPVMRVSLEL